METKPLFIPLNREYYEQFERGEKAFEMCKFGPRWNHGTCLAGRKATISLGYGKARRMSMVVTEVRVSKVMNLNRGDAEACLNCGMNLLDQVILIFLEKDSERAKQAKDGILQAR